MTNEGNRFNDVVALVMGVARLRGIGRATAMRLAAEGADVVCLDIAAQYEEAPAYVTVMGRRPRRRGRRDRSPRPQGDRGACDVSDPDAVEAAVADRDLRAGTSSPASPTLREAAGRVSPWNSADRPARRVPPRPRRQPRRYVAGHQDVRNADGRGGRRRTSCNVSSQAGKKGFAMLGRRLRGKGRRDPAHPDAGARTRTAGASPSMRCAGVPSTPTSSTGWHVRNVRSGARAGSTCISSARSAATVAERGRSPWRIPRPPSTNVPASPAKPSTSAPARQCT